MINRKKLINRLKTDVSVLNYYVIKRRPYLIEEKFFEEELIRDITLAIVELEKSSNTTTTTRTVNGGEVVSREEYNLLLKRFRHLLKSDIVALYDEVDPRTGEYKRDIEELDRNHNRLIDTRGGEKMIGVDKKLCNTGQGCTGLSNTGDMNSGYYNSGNHNSGNHNSGNYNSGNYNSGNLNTGYWNTGSHNAGDWNAGSYNAGSYNAGSYNTGDWNMASHATGCFNTKTQRLRFFDKESNITLEEWRDSDASRLLARIDFMGTSWIRSWQMTEEEKKEHPEHETTGGYLKVSDIKEACTKWWDELSYYDRNIIKDIPNFDAEKFFKITGIEVKEE